MILPKQGAVMMRGFFIFMIIVIGVGLVARTALDFQKHRSYSFKNIAILKKLRTSLFLGLIGAIIIIITILTTIIK